jgi:hypothetical protein
MELVVSTLVMMAAAAELMGDPEGDTPWPGVTAVVGEADVGVVLLVVAVVPGVEELA